MNALEIFEGSNGKLTTTLYELLETKGPAGVLALNLFRSQKASSRAKKYTRRYKGAAYDKKNWSLRLLVQELEKSAGEFGIQWGWKRDSKQEFFPWVLYVDLPAGQVSFHSRERGAGPDYPGDWDGTGLSAQRIVTFTQRVIDDIFPSSTGFKTSVSRTILGAQAGPQCESLRHG